MDLYISPLGACEQAVQCTWRFPKVEPSLTSKKAKAPAPASRPVFTQPPTRRVLPTYGTHPRQISDDQPHPVSLE